MNYKIKWKQVYHNWQNPVDTYIESVLQSSEMTEANELIERIKNL
jgi:hypothetical protein